jgi:hypothetical protein
VTAHFQQILGAKRDCGSVVACVEKNNQPMAIQSLIHIETKMVSSDEPFHPKGDSVFFWSFLLHQAFSSWAIFSISLLIDHAKNEAWIDVKLDLHPSSISSVRCCRGLCFVSHQNLCLGKGIPRHTVSNWQCESVTKKLAIILSYIYPTRPKA